MHLSTCEGCLIIKLKKGSKWCGLPAPTADDADDDADVWSNKK